MNASLVVVGSGIKLISHLNTETKAYIEQADIVLYLVNDPLMKEWIVQANAHAESLDHLYTKHKLRLHCYQEITHYILEKLRSDKHVCVVFYGHPAVFAQSALEAVVQARIDGYDAKVLPAISAEDCLFADLLIDPGSCGCQSYEATDFLIHRRPFSTHSHLILWQIGVIGTLAHAMNHNNKNGINVLCNYLEKLYSTEHKVIVYEAAQYPSFDPRIDEMTLSQLRTASLTRISTLYIKPSGNLACDMQMLNELNIDINELRGSCG